MTSQTKTMPVGRQICQNCKVTFLIDADDLAFYEMMQVPAPTFCPECRLQRRFAQRNERSLYKRKCDLCGESIVAMYSPNKPYKVYCTNCWYSDKWDALEYGRDYDPSQSFFQQLKELQLAVPHLSLFTIRSVNSPWINYEGDNKNGYLNFGGHQNEDCAFNQYALKCRDCLDNYWIMNGEYCYENILCEKSYKTMFSTLCFDCRDTYLSFDCRNCSDVIDCSGLRHKQYCIFNEYVGKEGYEKFLRENPLSSYESLTELKKRAAEFWRSQPQKAVFCEKSVNISGNLIYESKNCHDCVSVEKSENIKHGFLLLEAKDSYDMTSVWKSDLTYEFLAGIEVSDVQFSTGILDRSSRVRYSHLLFDCHDCFGCINMRKKQYCILNKQYDKASFDELKTRIIARMRKMRPKNTKRVCGIRVPNSVLRKML